MTIAREDRLCLIIGRVQPQHLGHLHAINKAFELAQNVLFIIGSIDQPRTTKNPFTYEERKYLLEETVKERKPRKYFDKLHIRGAIDSQYSDTTWVSTIQGIVTDLLVDLPHIEEICLLGHAKYPGESYDFMFPQFKSVEIGTITTDGAAIDATEIRRLMFERKFSFIEGVLPKPVKEWLVGEFFKTEEFAMLTEEYDFIEKYKKQWENTPYPVPFTTTDAVVIQGGHVLLVKRKSSPGKGLWALPGGFVGENETLEDGVLRELREETKIKVPLKVLRGSITHRQVFDAPGRSLRGRTITNAFLIELRSSPTADLPAIKGADDAVDAKWFPLAEALTMGSVLFEDHLSIIQALSARAQ